MMLSRSQSRQKSEEGRATASVIGLVRSLSMATEVPTLSNVDNTLDSGRWRRNWVGQLNDRIEAETSHLTSSAERPQPLQNRPCPSGSFRLTAVGQSRRPNDRGCRYLILADVRGDRPCLAESGRSAKRPGYRQCLIFASQPKERASLVGSRHEATPAPLADLRGSEPP
jgi:hypothetical protein